MKIENTSSVQLLQKGVFANSDKLIKEQESARMKTALETDRSINTFKDNKGVKFDAMA